MKELEKMLKSELIEKCLDLQGDLTASLRERRTLKEKEEAASKGAAYLREEGVRLGERLTNIQQALTTVAAMKYPHYRIDQYGYSTCAPQQQAPIEGEPEELLLLMHLHDMAGTSFNAERQQDGVW